MVQQQEPVVLTIPGKKYNIKKALKTRDSYCVFALCDPQYTYTLPINYTVSTALDSICHSVEAIYSKNGNDFTKLYGNKALTMVMPVLREFMETEIVTEDMRDKLYYGSIFAGMALNNGGTSCAHSLGYILTTMHNIPHGFACAAFIGEFLQRCSKVRDVSETLAALGVNDTNEFSLFIKSITDKYAFLPKLSEETISEYAEEGIRLNVNNNYLNISVEDCKDFYSKI